jgi:hypothetical protein
MTSSSGASSGGGPFQCPNIESSRRGPCDLLGDHIYVIALTLRLKVGISQYGSHVERQSWIQNQTGINVDIGTEGGGMGFGFGPNVDTLTSCFDHRGR